MNIPSREDILNDETLRINIVAKDVEEYTALQNEMSKYYLEINNSLQKERRELIKYFGTIAGGAAALAPQILDSVQQKQYFYIGIGLLCLTVVVAISYVLATIEQDSTEVISDLRNKNRLFKMFKQPKYDFLKNNNSSVEAFQRAMTPDMKALEELESNIKKDEDEEKRIYRMMDYSGEFVTLFFVSGLSMLVLSLTNFPISWIYLILGVLGIFMLINLVSSFPRRIFGILGFPIDLVKAIFRTIKR